MGEVTASVDHRWWSVAAAGAGAVVVAMLGYRDTVWPLTDW